MTIASIAANLLLSLLGVCCALLLTVHFLYTLFLVPSFQPVQHCLAVSSDCAPLQLGVYGLNLGNRYKLRHIPGPPWRFLTGNLFDVRTLSSR